MYKMKLNDVIKLRSAPKYNGYFLSIRRVPSGWIYEYETLNRNIILQFVPYSDVFMYSNYTPLKYG